MTPELERILSRVRKLLALSEDAAASEGERDNAIRMAHATLAKYNLDIAQVKESAIERIHETYTYEGEWTRPVCSGLARLFFCFSYREAGGKGKNITSNFVGQPGNVYTARAMAEYVMRSIVKEVNKLEIDAIFDGKRLDKDFKHSFCFAAGAKVKQRCEQLRKEAEQKDMPNCATGTSIVLAGFYEQEYKANMALLAKMNINIKNVNYNTGTNAEAAQAGAAFGSTINLNRQITSAPSGLKRLK